MAGCSAFCGEVFMETCLPALERGYATITTDMGHSSRSIFDAQWAYNNPEAEADFGYRATHMTALVDKALITAFYGSPPASSYFGGCSTGGRQGLVEAQRYPTDFDGIIAGAPPLNLGLSATFVIWMSLVNLDTSGQPILDLGRLPVLHQAVVAACDHLDGLTDGVIGDPRLCAWDPIELLCPGTPTPYCLTPEQVHAVGAMYAGPSTSSGEELSRGAERGSELEWATIYVPRIGVAPTWLAFGEEFVRYLAFPIDPGPVYDIRTFDFDSDPQRMSSTEPIYTASNPDMSAFAARGGKIIMYQGWADPTIAPRQTVRYYEQVVQRDGGLENTQAYFRLFMLPGVAHCSGGEGADQIDYLGALETWVEDGTPPDRLVGIYATGVQTFNRPAFPYPDIAQYQGTGDPTREESFRRVTGPREADGTVP